MNFRFVCGLAIVRFFLYSLARSLSLRHPLSMSVAQLFSGTVFCPLRIRRAIELRQAIHSKSICSSAKGRKKKCSLEIWDRSVTMDTRMCIIIIYIYSRISNIEVEISVYMCFDFSAGETHPLLKLRQYICSAKSNNTIELDWYNADFYQQFSFPIYYTKAVSRSIIAAMCLKFRLHHRVHTQHTHRMGSSLKFVFISRPYRRAQKSNNNNSYQYRCRCCC